MRRLRIRPKRARISSGFRVCEPSQAAGMIYRPRSGRPPSGREVCISRFAFILPRRSGGADRSRCEDRNRPNFRSPFHSSEAFFRSILPKAPPRPSSAFPNKTAQPTENGRRHSYQRPLSLSVIRSPQPRSAFAPLSHTVRSLSPLPCAAPSFSASARRAEESISLIRLSWLTSLAPGS